MALTAHAMMNTLALILNDHPSNVPAEYVEAVDTCAQHHHMTRMLSACDALTQDTDWLLAWVQVVPHPAAKTNLRLLAAVVAATPEQAREVLAGVDTDHEDVDEVLLYLVRTAADGADWTTWTLLMAALRAGAGEMMDNLDAA